MSPRTRPPGPRLLGLLIGASLEVAACHRTEANLGGGQDPLQIFAMVCARCHGADGKGGLAAAGANAPRNFCDAAFQGSRTDDDLKQVIRKGKGGMPAFGNLFTDPELAGLVRKVRSFSPITKRP